MSARSVVVLCVAAAAALSAALAYGGTRLATPGAQVAVSREPGTQSETTIVADPVNPEVLLAGSNSHRDLRVHAYGSTDGGATWTRTVLPRPPGTVASGDPTVAIDGTGRQYFGFVNVSAKNRRLTIEFIVASRPGPSGEWTAVAIASKANVFDDKPALAADTRPTSPHANRVYAVWTRITRNRRASVLVASSDNGGVNWSRPVQADSGQNLNSYPSAAVGADGALYVAWWNELGKGIFVARSADGGASFEKPRLVDPIGGGSTCSPPGVRIPAQPTNCVRPNPIVSVDSSGGPFAGRVYVTYGDTGGAKKEQDVFLTAFDPSLRPLFKRHRVHPPDQPYRSDQFWAASAVDQSRGRLWVCFYDTTGDRRRKRAFYTCTLSADGGTTFAPIVHAADVASNATVRGADTGKKGLGREYGDYEGLAVADGMAHPIWTDTRDLSRFKEEVYTTVLAETTFLPH